MLLLLFSDAVFAELLSFMLSQQETTYSKGQCQWCKAIGQDATRPVNHCNVVLGVGVPVDSVHPPGPPQVWLHTFTGDTPVSATPALDNHRL